MNDKQAPVVASLVADGWKVARYIPPFVELRKEGQPTRRVLRDASIVEVKART